METEQEQIPNIPLGTGLRVCENCKITLTDHDTRFRNEAILNNKWLCLKCMSDFSETKEEHFKL